MKKLFFMAVAAMAALSGCTSDNELELNKNTGKEALTFTATMEDSEATRATYDITNQCAAWEVGDQISINGKTYSAQDEGTTSTFKATTEGEEAEGPTYNAYFPADLYDGTTATLPANVSETWAKGQFNMPMYATNTTTDLAFKNLCGVLQITVKSDQLTSVKSITVSSSNCATSGAFTVDANKAAVLTNASNTDNTTTVTYTTAVTTDEDGEVFYVAIPPQTYKNLKIEVSDGTTPKVMTTKKDVDILVERNKIYPITFNGDYEYVDLGLSVKWATCNVGASSPEEYGDYYAWGETETKSIYSWDTYKWGNGSENTLTKYCTSSSYGTVDNKTELESSDDVAQVKWGGSWHMPTYTEMTELCENCTWTWIPEKNGYEVKSSNGNSIFLPAAGYRDSSLSSAGSFGYYWSSSLLTSYPISTSYVFFFSSKVSGGSSSRYYGRSVRPVCP